MHTFHGHVFDGYFGAASRAIVIAERGLARISDAIVVVSESVSADHRDLPRRAAARKSTSFGWASISGGCAKWSVIAAGCAANSRFRPTQS